ncbi:MAG TPA: PKD domain-containing protein, partial [Sphingobacterium sp.]|nr:PKD domain-containing protein [Sphingobacterium sp.]
EGYEATWVKSEQWITDFAFVSAYSSDNKTPIIKAVIPKVVNPVPSITSFTGAPTSGAAPQTVAFAFAFANMAAGYTAELDLGLGGSPINVTAVGSYSQAYAEDGEYTATLTIKDSGGNAVATDTVELEFT